MINWSRFIIGGVIASLICFVTDGLMHNVLLSADWKAIFEGLHATPPGEHDHNPFAFVYFAIFELGRGFVAMAFHVLLRERLGASAKTAAIAGVLSWLAYSVTGPVQMLPLKLFSTGLWLKMGAVQLVTSVGAAIAGAAPYKQA